MHLLFIDFREREGNKREEGKEGGKGRERDRERQREREGTKYWFVVPLICAFID